MNSKRSPFIVAEIGGNHLGSLDRAMELILSAKYAGADAVKFQCFTPKQMADAGVRVLSGPWEGRELLDLYQETHTPAEWFPDLFDAARRSGLIPFSSVFHPNDVSFLETLDCPIYKISSFELTDTVLIRRAAMTGKPLIISTGMATMEEIRAAIAECVPPRPTLLKCTSAYPSLVEDANLMAMVEFGKLGCGYGLSDHSLTTVIPIAATALGAQVIEKHLTLKREDGGPDAAFSLEPEEFCLMVRQVRAAAVSIGYARFGPTRSERTSLQFRRPPGGKRG